MPQRTLVLPQFKVWICLLFTFQGCVLKTIDVFILLICFGVLRQDLSQASPQLVKTLYQPKSWDYRQLPSRPAWYVCSKCSADGDGKFWHFEWSMVLSLSRAGWPQGSQLRGQHLCQLSRYPSPKALGAPGSLKAVSSFSACVDVTTWPRLGNSQKWWMPIQGHWVRDWFLGLDGVVVTQIQSSSIWAFCFGVPCLYCL